MKLRSMMGGLAALALSLSAGIASAETWEARTFNDLVSDSTACVKATVVGVNYRTINGATYTRTVFEIDSRAFGPARSGTIVVQTEGGPVSTATIPVVEVGSSGVQFFQGQEAILFLEREGRSKRYRPLNGGQGVVAIRNNVVDLPIAEGADLSPQEALDLIRDLRRSSARNVAQ